MSLRHLPLLMLTCLAFLTACEDPAPNPDQTPTPNNDPGCEGPECDEEPLCVGEDCEEPACDDEACGPNSVCEGDACVCLPGFEASEDGCVEPEADPCPGCLLCGDTSSIDAQVEAARLAFETLTEGVPEQPAPSAVPEDTNGTLALEAHPDAFPLFVSDAGVFAAASRLGQGRVVAFSGQDFLSSGDRSTLLGESGIQTFITNAVAWAAPSQDIETARVLADNEAVAGLLTEAGAQSVAVAPIKVRDGLLELRDWSDEALEEVDVAVVQVNEWGTLHVGEEDVEALRDFVEGGGGLIIAGSALHWSWWLNWTSEQNQGDAILEGTGISFNPISVRDVAQGRVSYDPLGAPVALWCAYVMGAPLESAQLTRVPPLFEASRLDGHLAELDMALSRAIAETPAFPVGRQVPEARLAAEIGINVSGHRWPQAHPWAKVFPGPVADNAPRIEGTVSLDTQWKRVQPLGFYAPPGEPVTVRVDSAHANTGLRIQQGELYDDLRFLDHIDAWRRAPLLVRNWTLGAEETVLGNGFGGSLYLLIPEDYPDTTIEVEVEGALRQAVFTQGVSSPTEFAEDLEGGAPLAILQTQGKVRAVVAADAARQVDDPDAVLTFWGGFYDSHQTLSQEPSPRPYESHWLFDIQVGWGYANATSARINFPELATGWAMRTRTGDEDWWLFAHELGHQFQTSDWSGGDITEVAVNLFSMYTLNSYLNEGGDRETVSFKDNVIDHAALEGMRWPDAGLFEKLELYRQLVFEFGWDLFRQVFASYYAPEFPRESFGSFMDGFAIRFSALSGRDITPFLRHWQYPLSDEGEAAVGELGLEPWLPPGW